jgi:hypothetical protein
MRIPSPPRDLTGERLAKEIPKDTNRVGSVYADEFLAHYCPPDFDDLQRRQFFCVLDLRRLKYAADEIFAKKDWKINILNFAKEYEKSRSLIMLRYGLYEFKTVKASEAVKKQWQKEHGIPSSDDENEADQSRKATSTQSILGRGKRKAEEELAPKNTALTASSSNLNKRRVTEPEPVAEAKTPSMNKSKRKADDVGEPEEIQPSKLHKSAASPAQKPSATKSIFERIANGTSNESFSSSASLKPKPAASPMFGATQPTNNRSILDEPSPAPSSNIFGHLSDASKGSGNDDADGESEDETASDADGEAEESEAQDASQSEEPSVVASGGPATPQFGAGGLFAKKPVAEAPSNTSSETGDSTKGRSLFDRMTYGNDGQPVRVLNGEVTPQPSSPEKEKPASPPVDRSATPTNKTWNTDTPIKFAPTSSQPSALFGAAPKSSSLFAPKETQAPAPSTAPAITLEPPTPAKEAEPSKDSEKPGAPSTEAPKPASTPQLFGAGASPFASGATTPAFAGFGSKPSGAASIFAQAKPTEEKTSTTPAPAPSTPLFGAKPTTTESDAAKPASGGLLFGAKPAATESEKTAPASTLFGAKPATSDSESSKPPSSPLFGAKPADAPKAQSSLFGAKPAESNTEAPKPASIFQSNNLFGNKTKADEAKPATSQANTLFGTSAKPAETPAAPAVGFSFGGAAAPSTSTPSSTAPSKPLFGTTPSQSGGLFSHLNDQKPATSSESKPSSSLFGTPAASGATTPVFGAAPATQSEPAKEQGSIFANPFGGSTPAPAEGGFKFGQSQSTAPAPSFGSQQQNNTQSTAPIFGGSATSSFTFATGGGGGGDQSSSFNNPFATNGSSSAPPSFNFGGNTGPDANASQSTATPFSFGGGAGAPAPSISFGAGSGASTPNTQSGNIFGGNANGGSFGSNFAFSGSQSQPSGGNIFAPQPAAGGNIFGAGGLAPVTGTSTGTSKSSSANAPNLYQCIDHVSLDSPFTFGGASSLATTPATGTPEPGVEQENGQGTQADGDDAPQEQISLTDGGPGEEDESVVHEVRAKAVKFVAAGKESDGESSGGTPDKKADSKSPWKSHGVGPLRLLKHKNTGAVRMLLRVEPRGHIALNKTVLPDFNYKADNKYVKIITSNDKGSGLETWMLQVKTKDLAASLAEALETHKAANKKK